MPAIKNIKLNIRNKKDLEDALIVLDILLRNLTMCDYGKLGFMDEEHKDREHITIDTHIMDKNENFSIGNWFNSANCGYKNSTPYEQIAFIKKFCDRQYELKEIDYDFSLLKELVEDLSKEIENDK